MITEALAGLDWYGLLLTMAFADRIKSGEVALCPLAKLQGDSLYLERSLEALLNGPQHRLAAQRSRLFASDILYLWVQRMHWRDVTASSEELTERLATWGFSLDAIVRTALLRYAYALTAVAFSEAECIALVEATEQENADQFKARLLALLGGH